VERLAGSADQGDAPGRRLLHRRGAGVRRRFPPTLERKIRGRPASGRGRPSAMVRLQDRSRRGSCAPGRAAPSPRRSPSAPARSATPSRRKDRECRCAEPRSLLHMLDGTLRVRFKDRDLAFTPFKSLPVPPPVEDDKSLDAVVARNASSATGSSSKGVDNGLARYGAMGGARRQAAIPPPLDPPAAPRKGTSLLARRRGHFYLALAGARHRAAGFHRSARRAPRGPQRRFLKARGRYEATPGARAG